MSERTVKKKTKDLFAFDQTIEKEYSKIIVGVDEVGRGPLAGPVVSAAVCLDSSRYIDGINDSKKLSSSKREELFEIIKEKALFWSVASCTHGEVDKINILQASLSSMKKALEKIDCKWELVLVDGNQEIPGIDKTRQKTIVGGDALSASIAAASIIAKVTRDRLMDEYHMKYPVYDFNQNKGYATEAHRKAIEKHGICEIHRKTFCTKILEFQLSLPL